jgi:hypothetical protein
VTGWDVQKEQHIYGPVEESFGPGQKIQLRESEATRLMKAGFVVKPEDYKAPPTPEENEVQRWPRE